MGEALAIYAEMIAARNFNLSGNPLIYIILKMFLLISIAGGFLILGYMIGFSAFKNIWIVSIASIVAILLVEPLLILFVFKQMPTTGAVIGFILGVIGLIIAMIF